MSSSNAINALPLGWTRIRRRPSTKPSLLENNNDSNDEDWCCDSKSCRCQASTNAHTNTDVDEDSISQTHDIYKGTAIFCLPDTDPDWFQGYLLVKSPAALPSFRLLCEIQEIDACLQCSEGGYRELQMQIISSSFKKPITVKNIQWTGGDLMRLQTASLSSTITAPNPIITMQTDSIQTGPQAEPVVEQVFASLLRNLRKHEDKHSFRAMPTVLELMVRCCCSELLGTLCHFSPLVRPSQHTHSRTLRSSQVLCNCACQRKRNRIDDCVSWQPYVCDVLEDIRKSGFWIEI